MILAARSAVRMLVRKLVLECNVMLPGDNIDLERPLSRLECAGFFLECRNTLALLPEAAPS